MSRVTNAVQKKMTSENSAGEETPQPSLVLSFDEVLTAYNSLQAAGKLKGRPKRKSSDAYKGPLNSEPGIRFETHSYFFAEYSDPVPAHASERSPATEAFVNVFLTDSPEDQLLYASRIYSWFRKGYSPIILVLHDHLANTVCYRSSKCRLFQPELDWKSEPD